MNTSQFSTTASPTPDPIITAIEAYRAGNAAYAAHPDDDEAAIEATYGPPSRVLESWEQPAQTRQGAIAALKLALYEHDQFGGSDLIIPLIGAALAYLERGEDVQ